VYSPARFGRTSIFVALFDGSLLLYHGFSGDFECLQRGAKFQACSAWFFSPLGMPDFNIAAYTSKF